MYLILKYIIYEYLFFILFYSIIHSNKWFSKIFLHFIFYLTKLFLQSKLGFSKCSSKPKFPIVYCLSIILLFLYILLCFPFYYQKNWKLLLLAQIVLKKFHLLKIFDFSESWEYILKDVEFNLLFLLINEDIKEDW